MRSRLIRLVLGCGLVAATIAPAFACQYQTNASNEQAPLRTAQAQPSSERHSE
jgi:hypothetical protein